MGDVVNSPSPCSEYSSRCNLLSLGHMMQGDLQTKQLKVPHPHEQKGPAVCWTQYTAADIMTLSKAGNTLRATQLQQQNQIRLIVVSASLAARSSDLEDSEARTAQNVQTVNQIQSATSGSKVCKIAADKCGSDYCYVHGWPGTI